MTRLITAVVKSYVGGGRLKDRRRAGDGGGFPGLGALPYRLRA